MNRVMSGPTLSFVDSVMWVCGLLGALLLRYDRGVPETLHGAAVAYCLTAIMVSLVAGFLVSLTYRSAYRVGSFEELSVLAGQFLISGFIASLVVIFAFPAPRFPRTLLVVVPILALAGALLVRSFLRAWQQLQKLRAKAHRDSPVEDVLIIGAGFVGEQLVRMTLNDTASPYRPVGLVDDDPSKKNVRISGVRVIGTTKNLLRLCRDYDVKTVIVGIAHLPIGRLNELSDYAAQAGAKLKVVVPSKSLSGSGFSISDLLDIDVEQILGRSEIHTDLNEVSRYLTNRRVLVTGAGGSIGSEIARQIHRFGPAELVLLDRDESALHAVQLDIYGKGLLDTRDMVLCDIRDREALAAIFDEHRPEVVFHAAALKHLPMLEQYPEEGWKTNVLGSKNVDELALEYGVSVLVNISTDKAADPTSVLGRSKRLAERITSHTGALKPGVRYVSVRFGNVLGSRGSMLWTFKRQIEQGGPVTVTHPDVERFFMTIPEACQLVLQAGAIGRPGEVMILDMGEPVKILDVARRLVAQLDPNVEIVFTGLRPGEKLSEELIAHAESGERPFHSLISHVGVAPLDPADLEAEHAWAVQVSKVDPAAELGNASVDGAGRLKDTNERQR